jgi:hypothetical protein
MSIYERNDKNERTCQTKINKSKKTEKEYKRPYYYNDYFLSDEPSSKRDAHLWFLIFITVVIFFPAIVHIVFSYTDIDKCQEMDYITTLNILLRFLGVYNIIYCTFVFLSIYFIYIRNTNENYSRMYNNYERSDNETSQYFFKIFITIFTIFMLTIQCLITYAYFQYFNHYCTYYTIIIYMWISLLIGILASIFIIFSIFFFNFD